MPMKKLTKITINQAKKSKNLLDFIGKGKKYSRFSTLDKVDRFISNNREMWKV